MTPPPPDAQRPLGEDAFRPSSSVTLVIPCLNEIEAMRRGLPAALALGCEVVVSDGGSHDGTAELARELGATVVTGEAGRGRQLNRGAEAAGSEVLLFLHADTVLPDGALAAVRGAISDGADGGAFRIRFDDPRPTMRLAAWLINVRTRWTQTPLGDQGQFATRTVYDRLRGYREWPILEDLDFARRLRREGKLVVLDAAVTTGARRFNQRGVLRTIVTNWTIWLLFFLGVSPHRLERLYRPIR